MAKAYRATTLWKLSMRREHAGHEQHVQDVGEGAAEAGLGEEEQQSGALLLRTRRRSAEGPVATVSAQELSAKKTATKPIGQEHHARHEDVRAAGLLGVHGCLLEAEEGGDAEAQRGADAGAAEGVRVEGVQGQALLAAGSATAAMSKMTTRATSTTSRTPSTRALTSIFSQPSAPTTRAAISAGIHQATRQVGVGGEQPGDLEAEDAVDADLEGAVGDERDEAAPAPAVPPRPREM